MTPTSGLSLAREGHTRQAWLGTAGYSLIFLWVMLAVILTPARKLLWVSVGCLLVSVVTYPITFGRLLAWRRLVLALLLIIPPAFLLGTIDSAWMGIPYSSEGLTISLQIALRMIVVLTAVEGFTAAVDPAALSGALERLGLRNLGFSLGVALNLLPALQETGITTWQAMHMRGGARRHGLRNLRLYAVTVIANALRRGEEIALAAEGRAFSPDRPHTTPLSKGRLDKAVLAAGPVLLIAMLLLP